MAASPTEEYGFSKYLDIDEMNSLLRTFPVYLGNRFIVLFPPNGINVADTKLSMLCHQINIPGITIDTFINKDAYFPQYQSPKSFKYEDKLSCSFFVTETFAERIFFESWINEILLNRGGVFQYPDKYKKVMEIGCFDQRGNEFAWVNVSGAFPTAIRDITIDFSQTDGYQIMQVDFVFSKYNIDFKYQYTNGVLS